MYSGHAITCFNMGLSQGNCTRKLSYWLHLTFAIAKSNMIIKTKKLSIIWNYLVLISKAEIPYLPQFYLNHKFLFTISLASTSLVPAQGCDYLFRLNFALVAVRPSLMTSDSLLTLNQPIKYSSSSSLASIFIPSPFSSNYFDVRMF